MRTSRLAAVGAFVVGSTLLFAVALFLIGDRRLLFARHFELYTELAKVTGLQVGSRVRLAGLDAGEVLEIGIPPRPSQKFRVRMRLRDDIRPLVRRDSLAAVHTEGIVGSAFVQIGPGTDSSPIVHPGDTIAGLDPVEFADLVQEGRETFRTVTREVVELSDQAGQTVVALERVLASATTLLDQVGREVTTLVGESGRVVGETRRLVDTVGRAAEEIAAGRGTVGRLLTDETLYQRLASLSAEAERTARNVRQMAEQTRELTERLTAPGGAVQRVAEDLGDVLAQTREVLADLSENTEALKRNFLFRGFFRQRGFYDLDAISREAYLGGALEGKHRTALRVWIEADKLFGRDRDGRLALTDQGKRRLDLVMADLARYPRESPLMVEGYATGEDGEPAPLVAEDRAALVRDYLASRFRRQTTLVDYIGLGDQAPGSPRGDGRWSGVALALFVRHDALSRVGR